MGIVAEKLSCEAQISRLECADALLYSGDDAAARVDVQKLLEGTGHFLVDLGALDEGGPLIELPFGALAMSNFVKI